ncbi:MAG: PDZ domain-containing protein [Acidobacteriota bacterium]
MKRLSLPIFILFLIFSFQIVAQRVDEVASPASISLNRERGLNMLADVKDVIREKYFDKNFRGIDLDKRFKTASDRIKTLNTNAQIFRVIAQVLFDFNDSHTRFYPPARANTVQYGFSLQMIGNNCFVVDVRKNSDADKQGLKVGDLVVMVNRVVPGRNNLDTLNYLLYALDPQPGITLVVRGSDNKDREIEIVASFIDKKQRDAEAAKTERLGKACM